MNTEVTCVMQEEREVIFMKNFQFLISCVAEI